jgi:hypothetical protein
VTYWTYANWVAHGHGATVHRGDCGHCNNGAATHGGGETASGGWHGPFASVDDARGALRRSGIDVPDCGHCAPG